MDTGGGACMEERNQCNGVGMKVLDGYGKYFGKKVISEEGVGRRLKSSDDPARRTHRTSIFYIINFTFACIRSL